MGEDRLGQLAAALLDRRIEAGKLAPAVVIRVHLLSSKGRRGERLVEEMDVQSVALELVKELPELREFVMIYRHTILGQGERNGLAAIMGAVRRGEGDQDAVDAQAGQLLDHLPVLVRTKGRAKDITRGGPTVAFRHPRPAADRPFRARFAGGQTLGDMVERVEL